MRRFYYFLFVLRTKLSCAHPHGSRTHQEEEEEHGQVVVRKERDESDKGEDARGKGFPVADLLGLPEGKDVEWIGLFASRHKEDEKTIEEDKANVDGEGDAGVLPGKSNLGAFVGDSKEPFIGFEDFVSVSGGAIDVGIGFAFHVLTVEVLEIELLSEIIFALHSRSVGTGSGRLLEGDECFFAEDDEVGGPGGLGGVESGVWIVLSKNDCGAVLE